MNFKAKTNGEDHLDFVNHLQRFADGFWLPDHVDEEQATNIILDAFKRKVRGQLELLDLIEVEEMNYPKDRDELRQRWEAGERFQFYFFYGHKQPESGVDASCLSQWFDAGFEVDGQRYPTAEHWMMAEKARLFDDAEMLEAILAAPDPKSAKAFGRKVKGFDQDVWNENRIKIVTAGSTAKFKQNSVLGDFLRSTGETILVEAAGRDVIWGIGLGKDNEKAQDPRTWRGRNLLGFALTQVRGMIG